MEFCFPLLGTLVAIDLVKKSFLSFDNYFEEISTRKELVLDDFKNFALCN